LSELKTCVKYAFLCVLRHTVYNLFVRMLHDVYRSMSPCAVYDAEAKTSELGE